MRNVARIAWSLAMGTLFLSLCLGLVGRWSSALADGLIILVAPDGEDTPGCGQTPACRTIKYAVEEEATAGDIIQVAAGVYTDSVSVMTDGLKIYGAGIDQSIVDGQDQRRLFLFSNDLTATTVLSGFTIQNGNAADNGGGIYIFSSSPTLQYLKIQNNTAANGGGGIFVGGNSVPVITASFIQNNVAANGGGLYALDSATPTLHNNTICNNSLAQIDNGGSGTMAAQGNWWGANSPQSGSDYSGVVTATPAISLHLTLEPAEADAWMVGTAGTLSVTMRGGGYSMWDGTRIVLRANQPVFSGTISTTEVILMDGLGALTVTPTQTATLVIEAYDDCSPDEPLTSVSLNLSELNQFSYLPLVLRDYSSSLCPIVSTNQYVAIPFTGAPIDHADYLHGDLNLGQRGYGVVTGVPLNLVNYSGGTDSNAPQLPGLFADERVPVFDEAYQVNSWDWSCGSDGCSGAPLSTWPTTLIGMKTTPGETIYLPDRAPTIYSQGGQNYKAMVLYAEETRMTITYVREDSVANGYSVQLENFCVDPNLLALYRAQVNGNGFRIGNTLPGLTKDQPIGTALSQLRGTVRDRGIYLDPRSRKDWWQGK